MAFEIGVASGHNDLLSKLHTFITTNATLVADSQDWAVERYDTATVNHELILRGPGLAGTDNIYVGIRSFENIDLDYYNWEMRGYIGYTPGDAFDLQPGASDANSLLLTDLPMNYWIVADGRHISIAVKVSTVFQVGFLGLPKPYATPGQFPYPVMVGGMYPGIGEVRWSSNATGHGMFLKGTNFALRFTSGLWLSTLDAYPYDSTIANNCRENFSGDYPLLPIVFHDSTPNQYLEMPDMYFIPGFSNAAENTFTESGSNYVVFQDAFRTDDDSYFALRLD